MPRGVSEALALAREHNLTVVRSKDGFVLAYIKDGDRHILVWIRKTPITSKAVNYMRRTLRRIRHDEVWLVKLYVEPDFDYGYTEYITRVFNNMDELLLYLEKKGITLG